MDASNSGAGILGKKDITVHLLLLLLLFRPHVNILSGPSTHLIFIPSNVYTTYTCTSLLPCLAERLCVYLCDRILFLFLFDRKKEF
jgi:hypothetical protein